MEYENDPKQLHDLLERHRTLMYEGITLKTPIRIGTFKYYATLHKEQINMRYGGTFDIDVTAEMRMPTKEALDLHAHIFFAMKTMNELPPFQSRTVAPELTAYIYGRPFLIAQLSNTNFSQKDTTVRLVCTYEVRIDEATIEKMSIPDAWPHLDPLCFL